MRISDVTSAPLDLFFSDANGDRKDNLPTLTVGVETARVQVEWNVEKFFDGDGANARKSAIASIASHTRT